MRKVYIFWALIFWSSVIVCQAQDQETQGSADEKIVMVQLEKPIVINETNNCVARVAQLNAQAVEMGLGKVHFVGSSEYSVSEDGSTRTKIEWHSVSKENGESTIEEPLKKPLRSQFLTSDPRAETGTQLSARGDWDEVLKTLQTMDANENAKVTRVEDVSGDDGKNAGGVEPVGPSSSSALPASTPSSSYDGVTTDKMTTKYEDCPLFVDEASMVVREQKRKVVTGESGTVYEDGLCQDTGVSYPIQTTPDGCGYQHNFEDGYSTQMVQWYYTYDGQTTNLGVCRESNSTFQHIVTTEGCDADVDTANGVVMVRDRIAFDLGGGVLEYATDCRASDSNQYPLQEEICDPKYEHDFVNGISYTRSRTFWTDAEGEEHNIDACGRSATLPTYLHKFDSDGCGWTLDDEHLQATQLSTRYIEVPADGGGTQTIELEGCTERGNPIPYAFLGDQVVYDDFYSNATETNDAQSWVVPNGLELAYFVVVAGGAPGGDTGEPGLGDLGGAAGPNTSRSCLISGDPPYWSDITNGIGGGGGGAAGEIVEYQATVVPGTEYVIHVGQSGEDSSITQSDDDTKTWVASWAQGNVYGTAGSATTGGRGGNGYVEGFEGMDAQDGFGAGGLGAAGVMASQCSEAPRTRYPGYDGKPGIVRIGHTERCYMRADGTKFCQTKSISQ